MTQFNKEKIFNELIQKAQDPKLIEIMNQVKHILPQRPSYQNYIHGLNDLYKHIQQDLPSIFEGNKTIIEVGPGIGCFMTIANAFNNFVIGEEAEKPIESTKFPGTDYINAYKQIHDYWRHKINYYGFHKYIDNISNFPYDANTIDIFHFRGSLDAILILYRKDDDTFEHGIQKLMELLIRTLKSKGIIWIAHNIDSYTEKTIKYVNKHRRSLQLHKTVHNNVSYLTKS